MPLRSPGGQLLDPSTEVLLAEHQRLSNLFLYNAELGEKRTASYLTLISLMVGALIALTQLKTDLITIVELIMGMLAGISLLGLLTFHRLVERRIRSTEYLRAINRIHAYFVQNDPSLEPHFHWPPRDDVPSFSGGVSDMAGLRDIIAALNSVFLGSLAALLIYLFWTGVPIPALVILGGVVASIVWLLQHIYENRSLATAEEQAAPNIRFPRDKVVKV